MKCIFKIRKLLMLVLAILLLQGTVVKAEKAEIEPAFYEQLCTDYVCYMKERFPDDAAMQLLTKDDVYVGAYYGNYSGYDIVFMYGYDWSYKTGEEHLQIGEHCFVFGSSSYAEMFLAYKDGCFMPVKVAYEAGNLTQQDVYLLWVRWGGYGDLPVPFEDVSRSAWYSDAVSFVYHSNLFNGVSSDSFTPNAKITRAMLVTILYRLEGKPETTGMCSFTDVAAGKYYTDAVIWAAENNLVYGKSDTVFAPNDCITREQIAAILLRYAQFKDYDTSTVADLSCYADVNRVSSYALEAVQWANGVGLIQGRSETELVPDGTATRAEAAAILMRFALNVIAK